MAIVFGGYVLRCLSVLVLALVLAASAATAQVAGPAPQQPSAPAGSQSSPPDDEPVAPEPPPLPGGRPVGDIVLGLPPVEFNPPLLDVGVIRPAEKAAGTIMIHNVSGKPLRILTSKADCSCTSVSLANQTLEPGQAIPLEIQYVATSTTGAKKAGVRILFEGYDLVEVPIRAIVSLPVQAEPKYIDALKDRQTGVQNLAGVYTVYSVDDQPFRVLAVNGQPPMFADFDPAKDQPRTRYQLKWDFRGFDPATCQDAQGRSLPGWLAIETDHPQCPIFDLIVRHPCVRPAGLKPHESWVLRERRVVVGKVTAGAPAEFEVNVKWRDGGRMADPVKTALTESQQFGVELLEVKPVEDGLICRLRVTPAANHAGLIYGTLRLYSNSQSAPLTIIGTVR